MGYYAIYLAVISPCSSSQGKFCQEGTSASQCQKVYTDDIKSG